MQVAPHRLPGPARQASSPRWVSGVGQGSSGGLGRRGDPGDEERVPGGRTDSVGHAVQDRRRCPLVAAGGCVGAVERIRGEQDPPRVVADAGGVGVGLVVEVDELVVAVVGVAEQLDRQQVRPGAQQQPNAAAAAVQERSEQAGDQAGGSAASSSASTSTTSGGPALCWLSPSRSSCTLSTRSPAVTAMRSRICSVVRVPA